MEQKTSYLLIGLIVLAIIGGYFFPTSRGGTTIVEKVIERFGGSSGFNEIQFDSPESAGRVTWGSARFSIGSATSTGSWRNVITTNEGVTTTVYVPLDRVSVRMTGQATSTSYLLIAATSTSSGVQDYRTFEPQRDLIIATTTIATSTNPMTFTAQDSLRPLNNALTQTHRLNLASSTIPINNRDYFTAILRTGMDSFDSESNRLEYIQCVAPGEGRANLTTKNCTTATSTTAQRGFNIDIIFDYFYY